jgi:hypothetical protein
MALIFKVKKNIKLKLRFITTSNIYYTIITFT